MDVLEDAISRIQKEVPDDGWISVKEQLPEKD
jgi:hypothetical protein